MATQYPNTFVSSNQIAILPAMAAAGLTLSAADSGKILILPAATAAGTLTLPALAPGLRFKFIMSAVAAHIITVSSLGATDTIRGILLVSAGANATNYVEKISPSTNVQFTATAAVGDWVEAICDGTNWYVSGASGVAAGLA